MDYTLSYSEDDHLLTLSGEIESLRKDRSFNFFLNSSFKVISQDNLTIEISISFDELEEAYNDLKEYLDDIGHNVNSDSSSDASLEKVKRSLEDFEFHSKKAKEIYWGDLQAVELEDFLSVVDNNFSSGRKLDTKQALSAYHLAHSLNGCNFSVPGSGKTTTVYAAYSYLKSKGILDKLLVIGPQSCFGPWEDEYFECFNSSVKSVRANKLDSEDRINLFRSKVNEELVLMGFQTLANHVDDLKQFLKVNEKVMVVIDEAHNIKRIEGGVWAPAALEIAPYATCRVILTGTPAPNGYEDLYNLFEFIWPNKRLINLTLSELSRISSIALEGQIPDSRSKRSIAALIESLKPFFVRIRKSDLNLPSPIIHPTIYVEMGEYQRSIYESLEDFIFQKGSGLQINDSVYELLKAQMIRLRQVATNPDLLNSTIEDSDTQFDFSNNDVFSLIRNYSQIEVPNKFITTRDLVKTILERGEKVVIWGVFVKNLLLMEEFLKSNEINCRVIYGDVPVEGDNEESDGETRESIIKEFHNPDSDFKVLIANAATVGESISLHKACSNAIYIERDYNAANFLQSKDRIHRKGLPEGIETNYYFIESANTIDADISESLDRKISLLEGIIEHPIPLFSILEDQSKEDISLAFKSYESRKN